MANTVRRKASNIFVWIILGLLFVGLAGFGVSNFGGAVRSVASVGETEIDANAYARALQTEIRTITQQTGQPLGFAEAQAMGVERRVLSGMIANAALDEAARRAGLSVGDAEVRQQILSIPGFTGPTGEFDREAYKFTLESNGLTVAQFEEQVRAELARNLLQAALVSGVTPGPAFGDAVYTYLAEGRTISVAPLTEAILEAPVAPASPEEVQSFYEETPAPFTLPERKAITYVWLTPEMLIDSVELTEAQLRDAYNARIAEFVRPERRMVDRLGFADEAAAEDAASAIAAGTRSFDAYLAERGLSGEDVDLGIVSAADLGDAAEGVFALDDTGIAGPLPSPVGPALYRVNAILSAQETSFEQAQSVLRADLAQSRAGQIVADEIEALEDLLAGGATLEELAAETDMQLGSLTWTGAEETGPAGDAAFAEAADTTGENDFPEIGLLDTGGIFALRLDAVIPAEVQPLEQVTALAQTLADIDKRDAALAARGAEMIPELNGGAGFDGVGLAATTFEAVSRRSLPRGLDPAVLEAAFALDPLETRLVETADGPLIVRLDAIVPAPEDDPAAEAIRASVTQEAASGMATDILTAVARAVQAEAGITTNAAAINAVHAQLP